MITVVLADDHGIVREGIAALLAADPELKVVGQAECGTAALALVRRLRPDVAVLDVGLPDLNGVDVALRIREICLTTSVLALSMHTERRFVAEMLRAGARGYLLKECAGQELATAVRAAHAGGMYFSAAVRDLANELLRRGATARPTPGSPFAVLSARERQVLQLLAEGRTVKEIAPLLGISPKTVETYRAGVLRKLGARNVADLTRYAVREQLTEKR